jgi:hypothetical protein
MEQREANGLLGVTFTADTYDDVRLWVQDRAAQGEIVATPTRLYLPVASNGMTVVDENDTVWWDPEATYPNAFSIERG